MSASTCDPNDAGERVRVEVESDESARRIEAVLGCLGFAVERELSRHNGDLFAEAAAVASKHYRLTEREHELLLVVLRGVSRQETAAQLGVTPATVKWHLHNIYFKIGVDDRELLLRRVLRLDDLRWLQEPRKQRDALEQLDQAAREAIDALRGKRSTAVDDAIRLLECGLAEADQLAGLSRG